jgi:hypothetical protein
LSTLQHCFFHNFDSIVVPREELTDEQPFDSKLEHMAEHGLPPQNPKIANGVTHELQENSVKAEHHQNGPKDSHIVVVRNVGAIRRNQGAGIEEHEQDVEHEVNKVVQRVNQSAD